MSRDFTATMVPQDLATALGLDADDAVTGFSVQNADRDATAYFRFAPPGDAAPSTQLTGHPLPPGAWYGPFAVGGEYNSKMWIWTTDSSGCKLLVEP